MHIALYHNAIIPPARYGGTERLIYWLARALRRLGHQVTLIAKTGSFIQDIEFISCCGSETEDLAKLPSSVDILHLWNTPRRVPDCPYLVTIGGNGQLGEGYLPNTVFVSKHHAASHGSEIFVYNGIDPDEYPCDANRQSSLIFLAKASWKVKNLIGAIEIARAVNLPLEVIGSRNWPFNLHRLVPRWKGVRYRGMLTDDEKKSILRSAKALIFPVRWPEPFGLAITESLASGCAVLGTPYGSLPEIITPSVGLLSHRADDLISILEQRPWPFDPRRNRARVFEGFTHLQMAESYVRLYESILDRGILTDTAARSQFTQPSETLLPWEPPQRH